MCLDVGGERNSRTSGGRKWRGQTGLPLRERSRGGSHVRRYLEQVVDKFEIAHTLGVWEVSSLPARSRFLERDDSWSDIDESQSSKSQ